MVRFITVPANYQALRDEWPAQRYWPDPGGTRRPEAVREKFKRRAGRVKVHDMEAKKWWNCNKETLTGRQRSPHSIYWKKIGQIGGYPPSSKKKQIVLMKNIMGPGNSPLIHIINSKIVIKK